MTHEGQLLDIVSLYIKKTCWNYPKSADYISSAVLRQHKASLAIERTCLLYGRLRLGRWCLGLIKWISKRTTTTEHLPEQPHGPPARQNPTETVLGKVDWSHPSVRKLQCRCWAWSSDPAWLVFLMPQQAPGSPANHTILPRNREIAPAKQKII